MSYKRELFGTTIYIDCICEPEINFQKHYKDIERKIAFDGYIPKTSMENLIKNIVLIFDCDDNYGEHNSETGCGGYGNCFTLDECFRYIKESGGYKEFDY